MIPYGRHQITQDDIDAVVAVLKSTHLTQGQALPQFEQALADYCQVEHVSAVCNGTAALHLACLALEIQPGDRVWTSPISFVASANAALYCGANIDFVDVQADNGNLCPEELATKLRRAAHLNALPKAIIAVHMGGQSCDMKAIYEQAQLYEIKVIEDASHALGAHFNNKPIGHCEFSDLSTFSFHPVKSITTGEGGAVCTNNQRLAQRLQSLRSHGISKNPENFERQALLGQHLGEWYYEQQQLGFNYRLSDIHAALGQSQLQRISKFMQARKAIAANYLRELEGLLDCPPKEALDESSWHLFIAQLKMEQIEHRALYFQKLKELGVQLQVHYIPIYLQPYYQQFGFKAGYCPKAERFYQRALSLPIYPDLTEQQQQQVVASLNQVLG